jgi:hypothetical protein
MTDAEDVRKTLRERARDARVMLMDAHPTISYEDAAVVALLNVATEQIDTLTRERDEARRDVERLCQWREDDSDFDTWKTGCGHLWQFNTGGPKENGTKFCQYCGGALTAALTQGDA